MDTMMVSETVFEACVVLCTLFVGCEFCQQMSNAFDETNAKIVQLHWYRFPIEIRRMIPTILMVTRRPVEFKYFGSVPCNRETFKKVWSWVRRFYCGSWFNFVFSDNSNQPFIFHGTSWVYRLNTNIENAAHHWGYCIGLSIGTRRMIWN